MSTKLQGKFDVKGTPYPADSVVEGLDAGRMAFHKTFHGELSGTSVVEMIGILNKDLGSGGYVAMERFTADINGLNGTFAMQHSSTMTRGKPAQTISVIPDTGTGQLLGLTGSMTIDIVEGKHFYTFEYDLEP